MIKIYLHIVKMNRNLTFATYNSYVSGPGCFDTIQRLCDIYDFVFIQEHWLLNKQSHMFEDKLKGTKTYSISGMKDNELLVGRTYGGCAYCGKKTLISKSLHYKVTVIEFVL